jgi:hypothetical protein
MSAQFTITADGFDGASATTHHATEQGAFAELNAIAATLAATSAQVYAPDGRPLRGWHIMDEEN